MKRNAHKSKFITTLNIILFLLFLQTTRKHNEIFHFTNLHQPTIIKYSTRNPLQQFSHLIHYSILHIADFLTFKSQQNSHEIMATHTHLLNIRMQSLNQTISQINQIINLTIQSPQINTIIELKYKISNYNTTQIYFTSNQDFPNNSLVMASNCLIGRIIGKQQNIYQILSIADPNFRLPAITQESQVFGMLYGGKTPKFIPFSNNNKEKINPNEPLLTISSTENFPPNIPIGTINTIKETFNIQTNCNNYHHYAFVL